MIPCAPRHLERLYLCYLKTFGPEIETDGFLKIEEATL